MLVIYDYIAGALGGIVGLLIGHPLDTLKVTLQVKHRAKNGRIISQLKMVASNGMKNGFYRGLAFPLFSATLQNSVFFGTYGFAVSHISPVPKIPVADRYERKTIPEARTPSYHHAYIAGCIGGLAQTIFFCPSDRIKVVLQSQIGNSGISNGHSPTLRGNPAASNLNHLRADSHVRYFYGPREAVSWLYKNHGLRKTFYRGYSALLLRDTNGFGIYILTQEVVRDFALGRLGNGRSSEIISSLVAGGTAGCVSWMCSMPFDVVKSIFQSDLTNRYSDVWHCARDLYRRHGLGVFYRGSGVVCLQALPVNGAILLTYTEALRAFRRLHAEI